MTNHIEECRSDTTVADGQSEVMDWSVLDALKVLQKPGRPDIGTTLMKAYLESMPALMEHTKAAVSAADGTALRNMAHSMKSSSTAIGAVLFGKTCAELEFLGKSNTIEEAPLLIRRAEHELAATLAALHKALAN